MDYTLVIIKFRFENLAVILHFPHLKTISFYNRFHIKNKTIDIHDKALLGKWDSKVLIF